MFDNDVNIDILPIHYETDTVITRYSQDNKVNASGGKLLFFCRQNTLHIPNGPSGQIKGSRSKPL